MSLNSLKQTTLFLAIAATSQVAQACPLTDWLYGRQQAQRVVVGFAPGAAVAPVATTGFSAAPSTPFVAGFAPAPITPQAAAPVTAPVLHNGVFQAQRPPLDNPSVITGQPIGTNLQTAFRVPVNSSLGFFRGRTGLPASPNSSLLGAANVYPNSSYFPPATQQVTAFSPGPATGFATPLATHSGTTFLPLTQNAPRRRFGSGLSRFFGNLFGRRGQRTTSFNVPVTFYRPVTSIDPTLGTTVTVQQPCTSTLQQIQRTPFGGGAAVPLGGSFSTIPQSGVAQVGAFGPATPINPAIPFGAPTTVSPLAGSVPALGAPLTGSPAAPRAQSDLAPVGQPSLQGFSGSSTRSGNAAAPQTQLRPLNVPQTVTPLPSGSSTRIPSTIAPPATGSSPTFPPAFPPAQPGGSASRLSVPPASPAPNVEPPSLWRGPSPEDSTAMLPRRSNQDRNPFDVDSALTAGHSDIQNHPDFTLPSFEPVKPIRALDRSEPSLTRQPPVSPNGISSEISNGLEILRRSPSSPHETQNVNHSPFQSSPAPMPVREAALRQRHTEQETWIARPVSRDEAAAPRPSKIEKVETRDNTWVKSNR